MLTFDSLRTSGLLRNLTRTQSVYQTSVRRLSSGSRINSAADDPAALVMSNTLRAEIGGLSAQMTNATQLGSMIGAASSAVGSQISLLQDIRTRAVEAADGATTSAERAALQEEVESLAAELDAIASSTSFNGQSLLDGSMGASSFSLGASGSAGLTVDFSSTRAASIGQVAEAVGTSTTTTALAAGELVINGVSIEAARAIDDAQSTSDNAASAIATAAAINRADAGVTAYAAPTTVDLGAVSAGSFTAGDLTLNGVDIGAVTVTAGDADGALAAAINAVSDQTGVTAEMSDGGQLVLTAEDGRNIVTAGANTDGAGVLGSDPGAATHTGSVVLTSSEAISVAGTDPASAGLSAGSYGVDTASTVENLDVSTEASSQSALRQIDAAIAQLSAVEAGFGAAAQRVDAAYERLSSARDSLSSARSRVTDTNVAEETARLSAASFLMQTQVALLAQMGQANGQVLQLLGAVQVRSS